MKVHRRTVPLDMLAFDHRQYSVTISTHHNQIIVNVTRGKEELVHEWLTPEQLIELLTARKPA